MTFLHSKLGPEDHILTHLKHYKTYQKCLQNCVIRTQCARQYFQNLLSMTWMLHFSDVWQVVDFAPRAFIFFQVNLNMYQYVFGLLEYFMYNFQKTSTKKSLQCKSKWLLLAYASIFSLHCLNMCKCNLKKNFQIAKLFS